ncbi:glycosyltransferase family 4 protein [Absicoccus porci]|uniref:glycosyltransferase family 4 protein n=1 Tax=Absicoccus porci TaxID=2486576 RepID=UPI002942E32B|nr:glycosyltransferase family 4 protein [Absicoccus porci]
MNILFLTLLDFDSIDDRNIYTDLLREFYKNGHSVYAISPIEKRKNQDTKLLKTKKATILKLKIGNIQKTNVIEKGISTLKIESQFIKGIKRYFSNIKFDLVLYSTPPITFCNAIEFVKKRDGAKTYLLLKDIFPQNAVDIGMLTKSGFKGLIYRNFRNKEKKLYKISDYIGCMSQANVDYVIKHNPEIDSSIVEVCPNSVDPVDLSSDSQTRERIRKKYGIPLNKTVFIYGGNLGKPQGIDFMIECLKSQEKNDKVFFLIVGDGTEFGKIQNYIQINNPKNVKLMKRLPKGDYDKMVGACDIGMIFLDHRFTIPNFPSRLLSYMQAKIPVLAVTDPNTDIGEVIVDGGFGWWCESDDVEKFDTVIKNCMSFDLLKVIKEVEWQCLNNKYGVQISYEIIDSHFTRGGYL